MLKKATLILIVITCTLVLHAQEDADTVKYWKYGAVTSINFSQVSFTNWAAGGENSYAFNGLVNLSANYSKDKNDWANTLEIGYGVQKQEGLDMRKTDDHIDFESKYGRKISKTLFVSAILNFKTQMDEGRKYETDPDTSYVISNFLAPAYLQGALGIEYKPGEVFYAVLSPVAGKLTMVMDDSLSAKGAFGVDPGETTRLEMGGSATLGFKKEVIKNVTVISTLGLFSNYLENPQNIDVDWKLLINMKINDYLSANLNTHLKYDDDIAYVDETGEHGAKVQFKELFGVGLTYKF